jgi:hypothetical protein
MLRSLATIQAEGSAESVNERRMLQRSATGPPPVGGLADSDMLLDGEHLADDAASREDEWVLWLSIYVLKTTDHMACGDS